MRTTLIDEWRSEFAGLYDKHWINKVALQSKHEENTKAIRTEYERNLKKEKDKHKTTMEALQNYIK